MSKMSSTDSKTINTGEKNRVRDFLLLCNNASVAEAVHALYYLPQNYKLMVLRGAADMQSTAWMQNESIKGRVQFEDMGTSEEKSPYSYDAVISDDKEEETLKSSSAPYVVVSATANAGIATDGDHGFKVRMDSPEALASALLNITRGAAAVAA